MVEVTFLDEASDLVLVVADSGPGIAAGVEVFGHRPDGDPDQVHGHGIGLSLSRDMVARSGGELWVIDSGGEVSGHGAVFGARLVGVMRAEDIANIREDEN